MMQGENPEAGRGRFKGIKILLGVCGSIAAYKSIVILRRLMGEGAQVQVVLTHSAEQFIPPLNFEVLSGNKVYSRLFLGGESIPHLLLAESSDLILVAPATANMIGKIANGIADDLLSTVLIATQTPVLIAPAMDGYMWEHPRLRHNLSILEEMGYGLIYPEDGLLASGKKGMGRLASEDIILSNLAHRLERRQDFKGKVVVVTAGPTRERIDPIRYLSNRSSGKMGYAIAKEAMERGARVILISGPTSITAPSGVELHRVETAEQMLKEVMRVFEGSDMIIMAAAVSDFRPIHPQDSKIKKRSSGLEIQTEATPDILLRVSRRNAELENRKILVGFAAETDDLLEQSRKKIKEKDLDLIVANNVTLKGAGFDTDTNIVTLIHREGAVESLPILPKQEVARLIFDRLRREPSIRHKNPKPVSSMGEEFL